MKKEIKKLWVDALRSGEYKQGYEKLKRGDRFCCLGVLTDVCIKNGLVSTIWNKEDVCETHCLYGIDGYFLPKSVVKACGLSDESPSVIIGDNEIMDLSALNDRGESFEKIADLIEEQL